MTKYVLVTSFGEDGYELYGKRMLESVQKHWPDDVDIHIWYHNFDLGPVEGVTTHNLNDVEDLINLRLRYKDFTPDSWRRDVVRFSHKMYALTETARMLSSDPDDQTEYALIWLDADTVTREDITTDWLNQILNLETDITLLERPVADYAETSFMRFQLKPDVSPAFEVLEDVRTIYDSGEVEGYREWHDGFIFQRVINLHQNHGLTVQNLSPLATSLDAFHASPLGDRMEHYKGDKKNTAAAEATPVTEAPIIVTPRDSVSDEEMLDNLKANFGLMDNWISRCRVHSGHGLIVSAGPSLDLDLLKRDYYEGKHVRQTKVLAVKHALPKLRDAGITPWGCIVLDPRSIDGVSTHGVHRKSLFEDIDPKTTFFVASMTNPSVTQHLLDQGAKVMGFHAYSGSIARLAEQKVEGFPLPEDTVFITGGTCAALRSVGLLHTLGFRKMTMFGMDGSVPEPADEDKGAKITSHTGVEQDKYLCVKINGKNFWTTGELLAMAQDCERLFDRKDLDIDLDFVGEGTLCSETWENRQITPLSNLKEMLRGN